MIAPSFTTLLVALSAACLASATPLVKPVSNLVYSPEITSPKAGDSWTTGSMQTVTWDTADLPADVQNYVGKLELGHPSAGSEHLDIDNPLATGFRYSDGEVSFTVPEDTLSRNDYKVFLFGDSGNGSPAFSITNDTNSDII